jgi:hypothetical protein
MPLFTLKTLITDCAVKTWKTRRMPKGIPQRERVQIYEEIWMALNLWLRSSMELGKGGHIPNFGTFCWELEIEDLGRRKKIKKMTPTFVLDDVMKREFSAKPWRRPLMHRTLTKHLEMNFTELAIRWSTMLTKDLVFQGLRDMLSRLRQVIKQGHTVKIRFGVGKLLVKERRVYFAFDPELRVNKFKKLKDFQTLPNSMTIAADEEIAQLLNVPSDAGSSFSNSRRSTPRGGRLAPLNKSASAPSKLPPSSLREEGGGGGGGDHQTVPKLDMSTVRVPEQQEEEEQGVTLPGALTFRSDMVGTSARVDDERDVTAFNADRSCVFAVSEKYRGGANPDRLDRKAMRHALQLAYERHLIDVEENIAVEETAADHWRRQLWERELDYRKDAEKKAKDLEELDEFLVDQIVVQKKREEEDYLDNTGKLEKGKAYPDFRRLKKLARTYGVYKDKEGRYVQATTLPDGERMVLTSRSEDDQEGGGDETERAREEDAVLLGTMLRDQIERRMSEMSKARRGELEEGRNFIEQIKWDSKRMLTLQEDEKVRVASEMKEAWDRDIHVRNVLKMRKKMLKRGGFVFTSKPPTPNTLPEGGGRLASDEAYERRASGKDGSAPRHLRRKKSSKGRSGGSGSGTARSRGGKMVLVNLTGTQSVMVPEEEDVSVGYDMRTAR